MTMSGNLKAIISPKGTKTERLDMRPQTTGLCCCYLWRYQNESKTVDQQ